MASPLGPAEAMGTAISLVAKALGAEGELAVAQGTHTTMLVFRPRTKSDAARLIGRRGMISNAIRELAKSVGLSLRSNYVFKVDDTEMEE